MRLLTTTLCFLSVLCIRTAANAQTADPFGAGQAASDPFAPTPAAADPFAADPFAQPPTTRKSNGAGNAAADGAAKRALLQRAKKVLANGRQPIPIVAAAANDAEQRINAAMDAQTSQTFVETPLKQAMQTISRLMQIPIVIDHRALEEFGLDADVSVNIDLRNVSLRSFLRLMLRDLDLTYMIKDEVLQITTTEAAEDNLVTEMYVLPQNLAGKSDQVIRVLTASVVPDTWEQLGGASSAYALDHLLIITTTSDVQQQVQQFLGKLIEKYGQ